MTFGEILDNYIKQIGCTAKELASVSDVSASVISRYRTGERVPSPEHDVVRKLAKGLDKLSDQSEVVIYNQLITALTSKSSLAKNAFIKVNKLVSDLNLKQADIARTFNYDASFISRVLSGQRFPSDIDGFLEDIAKYISTNVKTKKQIITLSNIIVISEVHLQSEEERFDAVIDWLTRDDTPTFNFLSTLNDFDIYQFLSALSFDGVHIPTVPFNLPQTKHYYGIQEMKQGEIEFMKAVAVSKSTDDVYLYSDMSMEDMLDSDFPRLYMMGLATLVKKGLHLNVIHNFNRNQRELFIGLEAWLPMYMTGQITPYYFEDLKDDVFRHLTYSSGTIALYGSCIAGLRDHGMYYLTKNKNEVDYFRQRSVDMLRKATPLMQIYKDKKSFIEEMKSTLTDSDDIVSNLYSPPIITATEELVTKILKDYTNTSRDNTLSFDDLKKEIMEVKETEIEVMKCLADRKLVCRLQVMSEEEFKNYPIYLSLAFGFSELNIPYTYETYMEHVELSKQFAEETLGVKLEILDGAAFRNVHVRTGTLTKVVTDNNGKKKSISEPWALVSKSLSPTIHFLIKHPALVNSLKQIEIPLKDEENDE